MKTSETAFVFILSLLLPGRASSSAFRGSFHNPDVDDCLVCNVGHVAVTHENGEKKNVFVCQTDDSTSPDGRSEQMYLLDDLPRDFVEKYAEQLHDRSTRLCIPKGHANPLTGRVHFDLNAESPRILHSDRRELVVTATGSRSVLVVRVSSTVGENPGLSVPQLQGTIFGSGTLSQNYSNTLVSQYSTCSQGTLHLTPKTGPTVVGGVLDFVFTGNITGGDITPSPAGALYTSLVNGVLAVFGIAAGSSLKSVANHVMFCVPHGALYSGSANWLSFAVTGGAAAFFNSGSCQYLSSVMHEVGHNLGFYHSGNATDQYGDKSCYMSYAYAQVGTPQMCFNAHKHFLATWYKDRQITYNPATSGPWRGTIVPFVDYAAANSTISSFYVVVNVGTYFLQLNSVKSFNIGNKGYFPNKINIVLGANANSISRLQAGLSAGQSFTVPNYSGKISLTFQVCNITFGSVDTAEMIIYLSNQTATC